MYCKAAFNNLGFSILEVIAAIFIITVGLVGVLSLVIQNIQAQYVNKNVLIASGLAQEGLELVRNVRDLNWLTKDNVWDQDLAGAFAIDYRGPENRNSIKTVSSIDDADARLYVNVDGFYTHAVSATATNFYRLITVVDKTNYLDVSCKIRWKQGSQNHDYTAETYLYNWR